MTYQDIIADESFRFFKNYDTKKERDKYWKLNSHNEDIVKDLNLYYTLWSQPDKHTEELVYMMNKYVIKNKVNETSTMSEEFKFYDYDFYYTEQGGFGIMKNIRLFEYIHNSKPYLECNEEFLDRLYDENCEQENYEKIMSVIKILQSGYEDE